MYLFFKFWLCWVFVAVHWLSLVKVGYSVEMQELLIVGGFLLSSTSRVKILLWHAGSVVGAHSFQGSLVVAHGA